MGALGEQWLASPDDSYSIDKSCMFDYASASYLTRTPGSAGNRRTWTMSVWLKMTRLASSTGGGLVVYKAGSTEFRWSDSNDQLYLNDGSVFKRTTGVSRDLSGWFHLCIIADTVQSTASERFKVYINGAVPTLTTDTAPAQNFDFDVNNTEAQEIGKEGSNYWDGYMADFHLIDGTAKAVGDFGETNDQGVWIPKQYTGGSYGTCGFHLDFADSSDIGDDNSGQGNDWTATNMGTDHIVSDTPTDNYAILNYNDAHREGSCVLSEGCLKWTNSNTGKSNDVRATFGCSTGKWYWECELDTLGQSGVAREFVGVVGPSWELDSGSGGTSFPQVSGNNGYAIQTKGEKISGNTTAAYGSAMSAGDIVGVALDLDNGKIWFSINGTYPNSGDPAAGSAEAYSSLSGVFQPAFAADYGTGNSTLIVNFGQKAFNTAAPTGFNALSTSNLDYSIEDPSEYFQIATWSGNSSTQTITFDGNSDMQPDLVWIKSRSNSDAHVIQEALTGVGTAHALSRTDSDAVTDSVTAFNSDGFALGDGSELAFGTVNTSSRTYVSMNWKANGAGSSNTTGTINTTKTSSNTTSGISISTYTGNGTDNATYGHGLGVVPRMLWTFSTASSDHRTSSTWVYGETAFSQQVGIDAVGDAFGASDAGLGKVQGGSSTTFTLGTDPAVNGNTVTYMSFAFSEIEGFSRFGSYTGTGSADGPFAFCGFAPMFILFKADRGGETWIMYDRKRSTFNPADDYLYPSSDDSEANNSNYEIDFCCNGFKVRGSESRINRDGEDIIFAAWAKHPLGGEDLAPATAIL